MVEEHSPEFIDAGERQKIDFLEKAGVFVSKSPASLGKTMKIAMQNGNI